MQVPDVRLEPPLRVQSWEDPRVLRAALRVEPGGRALSVGGGDSPFVLLLEDPSEVVLLSPSSAATRLTSFEIAMLRTLDREETLELLGERPSRRRLRLYERVRSAMPPEHRSYWQRPESQAWIRRGVLRAGALERYLAAFRRLALPLAHNRATVEALLACADLEEQRRFVAERFDTRRWRAAVRTFFDPRLMARFGCAQWLAGRAPVGEVGARFERRLARVLREGLARDNPYLWWMLTSAPRPDRLLPPHLHAAQYGRAAARVGRLRVVEGALSDLLRASAPGTWQALHLGTALEGTGPRAAEALLAAAARAASPGARLCYWNVFDPRSRPPSLAETLDREGALTDELRREDRVFLYDRVVVETVRAADAKGEASVSA